MTTLVLSPTHEVLPNSHEACLILTRYCPTLVRYGPTLTRYCPTRVIGTAQFSWSLPNSHEVLPNLWEMAKCVRYSPTHEVLPHSWGLPSWWGTAQLCPWGVARFMRYCPAHEACPILPTSWATTQLMRNSGLPSVPQTVNCADVTSSNRKGRSVHFGIFWVTGTNKMSTSARHEFQDYRHSTRNKQKLFI